MFFNSIDFAIFLPILFCLYWFVLQNQLKLQNLLIVAASYVFYGWWDPRFLLLIILSTVIDYAIGQKLKVEENEKQRKIFLWISLFVNLGLLGFFKYYNFFIDNFTEAFSFFGYALNSNSLNIILPVGISFYTFQTLSYTIDVYLKKLKPSNDFIQFSAFVSFFPQLVAGPIERATNLLPQFNVKRNFNYHQAADGLRQILWGLFKKVAIADNCAEYANIIFNDSANQSGSTLLLGAVFFSFQIYGDFSGYSDIAIGTSRLFGFNLKQNFAFPYFSRDIAEFWRRWHISLSTWFRDYLYIPLGGSRGSLAKKVRNTFIIFVVSGFWHGANWTFMVWGFLNALYFLPLLLAKKNRNFLDVVAKDRYFPNAKELMQMGFTFLLAVLAWIFFRADNITQAFQIYQSIFSESLFTIPDFLGKQRAFQISLLVMFFLIIEWIGRDTQYAIEKIGFTWSRPLRYSLYYVLIFLTFWFKGDPQDFIYFQF